MENDFPASHCAICLFDDLNVDTLQGFGHFLTPYIIIGRRRALNVNHHFHGGIITIDQLSLNLDVAETVVFEVLATIFFQLSQCVDVEHQLTFAFSGGGVAQVEEIGGIIGITVGRFTRYQLGLTTCINPGGIELTTIGTHS